MAFWATFLLCHKSNKDFDLEIKWVPLVKRTATYSSKRRLNQAIDHTTDVNLNRPDPSRPNVDLDPDDPDMHWEKGITHMATTTTSHCFLLQIGPEKGVVHMASAAILNAIWDLWAKLEEKPLWKLLVDLSPEKVSFC